MINKKKKKKKLWPSLLAKHHYQHMPVRTRRSNIWPRISKSCMPIYVCGWDTQGRGLYRFLTIINEYSYQWDDSIQIARDWIKLKMPPYRQRNSHGGGEAIVWPPHPHRRSPTTGRMASLTLKWRPSQKSGDSFGNLLLSHSETTQSPIYHAFSVTRSDRHLYSSAVEAPARPQGTRTM